MIRTIADLIPDGTESGVGLVLLDECGRYLFFLAGTRRRCPPGELFYAGIGGHREEGEDWLTCAHREALEEVGADIHILPVPVTWYLPHRGPIRQVEIADRPRALMLYEMIHPPDTPRAGELYRIVIFKARLCGTPQNLPPDEVQGVIALTGEQVARGLERKPLLADLLDEGALLIIGDKGLDRQVRLYPLGTARALAYLLCRIDEERGVQDPAGLIMTRLKAGEPPPKP